MNRRKNRMLLLSESLFFKNHFCLIKKDSNVCSLLDSGRCLILSGLNGAVAVFS